ncbi:hypothetical protein GF373_10335 [bacterium]|nr:hypothetical protein [bacterium]
MKKQTFSIMQVLSLGELLQGFSGFTLTLGTTAALILGLAGIPVNGLYFGLIMAFGIAIGVLGILLDHQTK